MSKVNDIFNELSALQKHIILLLYARDCEPIPGVAWFQKELYLVAENVPEVSKEAGFVSGAYGPCSKNADDRLKDLVLRGMVNKKGNKISLSDLGVKVAHKVVKEASKDTLELLDDFKGLLNDMSGKELTTFIYLTFPESDASLAPKGIKEDRVVVAKTLYRKGKLSLERAAEIAGVSVEDFRQTMMANVQ